MPVDTYFLDTSEWHLGHSIPVLMAVSPMEMAMRVLNSEGNVLWRSCYLKVQLNNKKRYIEKDVTFNLITLVG